ncbi:MAG: hypothetical protein HUU21_16060, partial [Polyangiaceae bacterium]|nr:hypothetical protein [Polyangiaceae bacterium]
MRAAQDEKADALTKSRTEVEELRKALEERELDVSKPKVVTVMERRGERTYSALLLVAVVLLLAVAAIAVFVFVPPMMSSLQTAENPPTPPVAQPVPEKPETSETVPPPLVAPEPEAPLPADVKAQNKAIGKKITGTSVIKNALKMVGTPFLYKPSRVLGAMGTKNNQET